MKIAIFGLGYVGMTSAVCLAQLGHKVTGIEISPEKVALIAAGRSPILEPGVEELLTAQVASGDVNVTADAEEGLRDAEAVLVAVGTPSRTDGSIDDGQLVSVISDIGRVRAKMNRTIPILVRSTALPESHNRAMEALSSAAPGQALSYCVHPEFLRAGQAVRDFHEPPKIVFGITDQSVNRICAALYPGIEAPTTITDPMTAALVKYADNVFHAVKITYTNEISQFASANGVDARRVLDLVVQDKKLNISPYYMRPGFAFGGSCLPKDLRAALSWGRRAGIELPMLEHVLPSNRRQIDLAFERILDSGAKTIGLFGLAFKANTDDVRESPLVALVEALIGKGRELRIYDPALIIERMIGKNRVFALSALPHLNNLLVPSADEVVKESELIVLSRAFGDLDMTELPWRPTQKILDLSGEGDLLNLPAMVDGLYWNK